MAMAPRLGCHPVIRAYAPTSAGAASRAGRQGGSSIVMVCSMPGMPRCRACSHKVEVAAQADDASGSHPQKQVTRQRGRGWSSATVLLWRPALLGCSIV